MEITAPSGLKGIIRGLKVKEMTMLTDLKLLKSGKLMTEVVKNCWVKTTDKGPYPVEIGPNLRWEDALNADRTFVFKEIQSLSYGNEYAWEVQCVNQACLHRFEQVTDLTQLKVKGISDLGRQHLQTGFPLKFSLGTKEIEYRLLRANDDEKIIKLTQKADLPFVTAMYMARLVSVAGVDIYDLNALKAWVEDLDIGEGETFSEELEKHEPALDTRISVTCTKANCATEWTVVVPLVEGMLTRKTKKQPNKS